MMRSLIGGKPAAAIHRARRQHKFYAPGVGNIQITAVDDPEGETLELTQITHLSAAGLAGARASALKLDQRGYRVSAVYRSTAPALRR